MLHFLTTKFYSQFMERQTKFENAFPQCFHLYTRGNYLIILSSVKFNYLSINAQSFHSSFQDKNTYLHKTHQL